MYCVIGNYIGIIGCRFDQYVISIVFVFLFVRNCIVVQWYFYEVFFCVINCFGNCFRYVVGFFQIMINCIVIIVYDNDSGKIEGMIIFGYFCNVVEVDQFFFEFGFSGFNFVGIFFCYYLCCCR